MIKKSIYVETYRGGLNKRLHTKYQLFGFITLYHTVMDL